MDYIKSAFERMKLFQIRSFLLNGTDDFGCDIHPYHDTIEEGCSPIRKRLERIYPDGEELDEAADDLCQALNAYEQVYTELGMKAGARILFQLLLTDDQPVTPAQNE